MSEIKKYIWFLDINQNMCELILVVMDVEDINDSWNWLDQNMF